MAETNTQQDLIALAADIVAAHVSHNNVGVADVPGLIRSVYDALVNVSVPALVEEPKPEPVVSIRASIKPDYLVCLEDGKKLKMLKRYLRTNYNMSPDEYRAKWGLPKDYPMVAPSYRETRSALALKIGLGTKREHTDGASQAGVAAKATKAPAKANASAATQVVPAKRGRPAKAAPAPAQRSKLKIATPK